MSKNESENQYVVGMGASAGGLEAIQTIVACLPKKIPNVAIVIAQHLSPDYKSMLVELLSRKTNIPVKNIESGMDVAGGAIYIAPPSSDVVIKKGRFAMETSSETGAHPSVDRLIFSIAKHARANSAAVILSGTGKDGSKGIAAIKSAGGIVIAQDPDTAKYEGMPQSAVNTKLVDQVASPEKIGKKLMSYLEQAANRTTPDVAKLNEEKSVSQRILRLLESRVGVDFSDYKTSTLQRRLDKRIQEGDFQSEEAYYEHLLQSPEEVDALFGVLLIGVTEFYRDKDAFGEIEGLLGNLIKRNKENEQLRIWIPGCATGEEAYTYAMILTELMHKLDVRTSYQIFATDIDTKALQKARIGIYSKRSVKNVPKSILKSYFKKVDEDQYEVSKSIRKHVLFSKHDVTSNPPFLRLDLISCRNLLIYFNSKLQKHVLPLFYYALNSQGYLVLGKSENINRFQNLFSSVNSNLKLFKRANTDRRHLRFPSMRPVKAEVATVPEDDDAHSSMTISEMVKETLFTTYEQPYVVVDEQMDIEEISGDVTRYLQLREGAASLNLYKLINPELQIELRAQSGRAISSKKPVSGTVRKFRINNQEIFMNIAVKPLLFSPAQETYYLVIFNELPVDTKMFGSSVGSGNKKVSDPYVKELEQDLSATKEYMNTLIEELESSNEELQSMNEEMQASNEELQASNEELETSNEELQATNEELENAYSELREANDQVKQQKEAVARSARHLATVLNSSLVGYVLIDKNHKVLLFNKTAKQMYKKLFATNLKEDELHINFISEKRFPEFHTHFKKALKGSQLSEEKVLKLKNNETVCLETNFTPVAKRKGEAQSELVVFSFIDITGRKMAENNLKRANTQLEREQRFMQALTDNLPSHIWTKDDKGSFTYINKEMARYLGASLKKIGKKGLIPYLHSEDVKNYKKTWIQHRKNRGSLSLEFRLRDKDGVYRWFISYAEPVKLKDEETASWIGFSTEIDSLKRRAELEESVDQLTRRQQELVQSNRVKDEFISLASHQLRTPATAVKQYIRLILDEYAGPVPKEQASFLQTAYMSNERQLGIINDLLKTAQVDASSYTLHKAHNNVAELIEEVIEEMSAVFELRKQKLVFKKPDNPVVVSFDRSELKLVIVNLLDNASKYSHENTEVTVRLSENKGHIKIEIEDQGVGLTEGDIKHIFDKFVRVDNELSDTVSGTGLGLYIANRIIEAHNGAIDIKNRKGGGSIFIVRIAK